jgi:hypothetical protein
LKATVKKVAIRDRIPDRGKNTTEKSRNPLYLII